MKRIGVMVPQLNHSQMTFSIIHGIKRAGDSDIIVFCENQYIPIYHYEFATMPMIHAYNYNGPLIATSLSTAKKLIDFPTVGNKYFYIWDLEWVDCTTDKRYKILADIYQNTSFSLITRSESHKNLIEKLWNVKIDHVVKDFNFEDLPCEL